MCGISGLVDFQKRSSKEILEKMNQTMPHRGPDGEGYCFFEKEKYQVGFGHKRLSIIDLNSHSNQPMYYNDLTIVFNGEIYNYKEIRIELEKMGHKFQTNSDTEVILQSIARWGSESVHKFIGMFAFGIYNAIENAFYLFRDRVGVKPVFYYYADGLLLFGSELKVLMAHPHFPRKINCDAVAAFMDYGYVPTPNSIFMNTFKLEPGSYLKLDLNTNQLHKEIYWDVNHYYIKPHLSISYSDATNTIEALLKEAYQYRMVSDVPVGVFLSGGYDSSSVAAILQSQSSLPIKTFTIGVREKELNEAHLAKEIAKYLGTEHHELYCNEAEMLEILPDLPKYYCEPFADSSAIPTILVSRLAAQHVKVALSADGGDEVFGGYNRYGYAQYMEFAKKIHPFFTKPTLKLFQLFASKNGSHTAQRLHKIENLLNNSSHHPMRYFISHFSEKQLSQIVLGKWKPLFHPIYNSSNWHPSILTSLMATDFQSYLVDDILVKVDRATMSASIEGREPLLDHRIIEFMARLPNEYKIYRGQKKRMLKDIVHRYIPKKLITQKKMGFSIPLNKWLHSEIVPKYQRFFDDQFIEKQGIFNPKSIGEIQNRFQFKEKSSFLQIWHYIVFQMWWEEYMNYNY